MEKVRRRNFIAKECKLLIFNEKADLILLHGFIALYVDFSDYYLVNLKMGIHICMEKWSSPNFLG